MKRIIIYILFILLVIPSFAIASSDIQNGSNLALMVFKSVIYVVIFIVVIFLAIYGTKFIARKSQSLLKSKYIHIIDSVNVGQNTKIIIAKISNYIYIISISNNQTFLIDKMKMDEFFENIKNDDFEKYLNEYMLNNRYEENNSLNIKVKAKEVLDKFKSTKKGKEDEKDEKDN